jgi:hypothetical protein
MAQNRVNVKEIVNEDAASAANKMAGVHITAMTKRLEPFLEQFKAISQELVENVRKMFEPLAARVTKLKTQVEGLIEVVHKLAAERSKVAQS